MTTQQHGTGIIPSFTQGDRLRKTRELTGMNNTTFAERIGVSQKTVNNAEADRVEVRPITPRGVESRARLDHLVKGRHA